MINTTNHKLPRRTSGIKYLQIRFFLLLRNALVLAHIVQPEEGHDPQI